MIGLLTILATFLALLAVWTYVINPLIEWLIDLGERRQAARIYAAHDDEAQRLAAVVRVSDHARSTQ